MGTEGRGILVLHLLGLGIKVRVGVRFDFGMS